MHARSAAAALVFLLAGCNKSPTVSATNASVAEVQEKVKAAGGQAIFLAPGHWDSTVKIDRIDIPGMPPGIAQHVQSAMAGKISGSCLTPEEAKKPAATFFAGKDRKDCVYDHFTMGDGKLDTKMTCKGGEGGGAATIAMTGGYTPDSFHLSMTMDAHGSEGPGAMKMAATVDSKRTAACTGKESS